MKKILIFSLAYYPDAVGGAEVAIKEITDRIKTIEFHMVTLRYDRTLPRKEKIGNVVVHRIGFSKKSPTLADLKKFPLHINKYIFQFYAAFKAVELHKKYKFDATWAMMAHSCGVPTAIFKMLRKDVPFVLTLQEGDPTDQIERTMKPIWFFFKRAFTSADVIQPISSFLAEWAKKMGHKGEIKVIPNGFNPAAFANKENDNEVLELKKQLGKKEGEIYLVTISRLVHKNGIDDVIRALKRLGDNIKFIVVGGGPDDEMLKNLAKEVGVEKRVVFIGHVDRTQTAMYRRACDIFVRPSRSEGMGNSFVSTMVAGMPIITTQEGGIRDFLFDGLRNPDKPTTGWAVDKDSPEQISRAVEDILNNPEKAKKVTENAYNLAHTKYDWDNIVVDMENNVFRKVMKN